MIALVLDARSPTKARATMAAVARCPACLVTPRSHPRTSLYVCDCLEQPNLWWESDPTAPAFLPAYTSCPACGAWPQAKAGDVMNCECAARVWRVMLAEAHDASHGWLEVKVLVDARDLLLGSHHPGTTA